MKRDNSLGSVLVTRPSGQAEELCSATAAAGFSVHSLPMLQVLPLPELVPAQRQLIIDLNAFRHVIFVSGNAVRHGMALIEALWPQLPWGLNWYAVGAATARLLEPYGIRAHTPGSAMSSEGLLAMPQLRHIDEDRVLIIKGEGGRNTLASGLAGRGARVDELACYRRAPPDLQPGELARKLSRWSVNVIMITSAEGLGNLLALLSPPESTNLGHITLVVPSKRVAQKAQSAGFSRVITAENASDGAMLRALGEWQTTAGD